MLTEFDEPPLGEGDPALQFWHHAPPHAEFDGAEEFGGGGYVVSRRGDSCAGDSADEALLEDVVPVELHHRCGAERLGGDAVREMRGREVGGADRAVAVGADARARAPGYGLLRGGERGDRLAAAQRLGGERLVSTDHLELRICLARRPHECRDEPGGEGIGIDDDGHQGAAGRPTEFAGSVIDETIELSREAQDCGTGRGHLHRPTAAQEHGTDALLHRLHPLADCGRGDVQTPGGTLEAALLDDGGEGGEVLDR